MKRQARVEIDINSLSAGVNITIYGITLLILMSILFASWLHERCNTQHSQKNTLWHLLISLFPMGGQMWPNQTGVTRKLIMATSGFGMLILSSLYQARLSEQLLIPYAPPVVTLKEIEYLISSGSTQLLIEQSTVWEYVSLASSAMNKSTKPMFSLGLVKDTLEKVDKNNLIYIDTETAVLAKLQYVKACEDYVYVPFDEWTRMYSAIIMRKERGHMLESMNTIIAERMSFVDDYVQSFQLEDECREQIFPVYTPNPKFESLQLVKITGALAFLFLFLCISVFVLLAEIISHKRRGTKMEIEGEFQTFDIGIHLQIDNSFASASRQEIFDKYVQLLEAIDRYK
jgi:hypothetical protein